MTWITWKIPYVSAASRSLETQPLSAIYEQCQGWLTTVQKNARHTDPLIPGLAFFEIVRSASITMAMTVFFVFLWILLTSSAKSWYLSTFSSSLQRILVRWQNYVDKCPLVGVLHTTVISSRLCFSSFSVKMVISQVILTSLFSATLWDLMVVLVVG